MLTPPFFIKKRDFAVGSWRKKMIRKEKNKNENTTTKATRLSLHTAELLENYAKKNGCTVSQVIKLSVLEFLKRKRKYIRKEKDYFKSSEKGNSIQLRFSVNKKSYGYKKLIEETEKNQKTLQQEIRHRLSYTLQKNDLEKLEKAKIRESLTEISRLGNLLKLAINQQSADEKLLREINKNVSDLKSNLRSVFVEVLKKRL